MCFCHFLLLLVQSVPGNNFLLKPVFNWANVCSPDILWTLRGTMISFLI